MQGTLKKLLKFAAHLLTTRQLDGLLACGDVSVTNRKAAHTSHIAFPQVRLHPTPHPNSSYSRAELRAIPDPKIYSVILFLLPSALHYHM